MRGYSILLAFVSLTSCMVSSRGWQYDSAKTSGRDTLVIMSYNVENFFHCDDDSLKNDDDFTPTGQYAWCYTRMSEKADRIKKVITTSNGWNMPAIIGLCEVEGPKAVDYLVSASGLFRCGYKGLCYPTSDKRGVSVALLYDQNRVDIVSSRIINVSMPDSSFYTRDVLYAKFAFEADTFHVLVNHWPSKYGGAVESAWKRDRVASIVRSFCDSILEVERDARLILVGDFNDDSNASSLRDVLGARSTGSPYVLLSGDTEKYSYKYRGRWDTIDHIIVSESMCRNGRPLFSVCDLGFIKEADDLYGGVKPFRTYVGLTYHGGFSDHFPVMLKVVR